jgi:hypothetical protein
MADEITFDLSSGHPVVTERHGPLSVLSPPVSSVGAGSLYDFGNMGAGTDPLFNFPDLTFPTFPPTSAAYNLGGDAPDWSRLAIWGGLAGLALLVVMRR